MLEWLSAGRPVLSSPRGGLAEAIATSGGAIEVEPAAAAIADAVGLLRDPARFGAAVAAISTVPHSGDEDRWIDEHADIFRRVVAGQADRWLRPRERRPMIDTHCHILPGLDDGPPPSTSRSTWRASWCAQGVGAVAATSHVSDQYPNSLEDIADGVEQVREALREQGIPLHVLPAAEMSANQVLARAQGDLSGFALGQAYVLVEPPRVGGRRRAADAGRGDPGLGAAAGDRPPRAGERRARPAAHPGGAGPRGRGVPGGRVEPLRRPPARHPAHRAGAARRRHRHLHRQRRPRAELPAAPSSPTPGTWRPTGGASRTRAGCSTTCPARCCSEHNFRDVRRGRRHAVAGRGDSCPEKSGEPCEHRTRQHPAVVADRSGRPAPYWWVVASCVVGLALLAFVYSSLQTAKYEGVSKVVVKNFQNLSAQLDGSSGSFQDPNRVVATQAGLVKVPEVLRETLDARGPAARARSRRSTRRPRSTPRSTRTSSRSRSSGTTARRPPRWRARWRPASSPTGPQLDTSALVSAEKDLQTPDLQPARRADRTRPSCSS